MALVQGNVPGVGHGLFGEREQVLRNHVDATHRLAADVRAGRVAAPDLVVWPENASDIDPFHDPAARALIDGAVRDVGVPVLVGAVLDGPGPDHVSNTGIVWDPRTGPGARYVKRHPVPFGEYIPFRAELTGVISRLDQIPRDFYAGHRARQPARSGRPGSATSSASRWPTTGWSATWSRGGAQVLVVQTNNATYSGTGQPYQQMAMSRLRAVETRPGRAGRRDQRHQRGRRAGRQRCAQQAPEKVARTLVAEVPLRDRPDAGRPGWASGRSGCSPSAGWPRLAAGRRSTRRRRRPRERDA